MLPPYHAGSARSEIVTKLREGHPASSVGSAGTSGSTKLSREELDKFCAWIDLAVPLCGDYVERNTWSDAHFDRYIHYQRKRESLAAEVRRNTEALYEQQTAAALKLKDPPPRYLDYVEARRQAAGDQ
jgi:hypothetical protein